MMKKKKKKQALDCNSVAEIYMTDFRAQCALVVGTRRTRLVQ